MCGYVIEKDSPVTIHLFEIEESPGRTLNNVLIGGCRAIRDQLFPARPLCEIQWRYSNGICHSEIAFVEKNGKVEKIHLGSDQLGGKFYKRPLEIYQRALDAPEGFENNMSSGHGFIQGNPTNVFPIALKGVDDGYVYFKPCGYGSETSQTILADSRKLIGAWIEQENNLIKQAESTGLGQTLRKKFGLNSGRDNSEYATLKSDYRLFQSDPDTSLSYLKVYFSPQTAIETALLNFNAKNGSISYTNGRHRTFNTANAGSEYVVITVDGDVEAFKEKFEWQDVGTQSSQPKWLVMKDFS